MTGSADNTVKVWDLRKKANVQTIAAHNQLVSDVKFTHDGALMLTASYDQSAKIWSAGSALTEQCHLVRTLDGAHENKLTSINFTQDLKYIFTTSFDRTFKLWQPKTT